MFSATMASILCASNPSLFRFAILIGGFRPKATDLQSFFSSSIPTPSLHVYGQTDSLVTPDASKGLRDCFAVAETFEHPKGHLVPSDKAFRTALRQFVESEIISSK